jgi:hypothetical protein
MATKILTNLISLAGRPGDAESAVVSLGIHQGGEDMDFQILTNH